MKCANDVIQLMHKHLDDGLNEEETKLLKQHLQQCDDCQSHFHELKRTVAMVQSTSAVQAPPDFTAKVMGNLPKEKKRSGYKRWFKAHPMITAAAIFFILMFSGIFSTWSQDQQLSVSKQKDIVIQENTVIVPEGKTVEGDLVVKNGNLKVEGKVNGDVVLINGDHLKASAGEVTGELNQVDQIFGWMWYNIKKTTKDIFSFTQ
ncbi:MULTISPECIES: anti-sigma factor family protein [Pontibacillus]|uniref:Anti-sigma-W factor RsiW n=1 Tax=Pontibacillus chungwhensis TaxID=265426 RepID=A0ABY8UXA8_9BACI|nr:MULTISPECIES: anti-sigma factor [Pontibacillus]MCD5325768.1 anti-sigma factor [Pontibacillus sp. HN14]WIF98301.1 anti-sigma factor [Pontibacillus chungwhensis]